MLGDNMCCIFGCNKTQVDVGIAVIKKLEAAAKLQKDYESAMDGMLAPFQGEFPLSKSRITVQLNKAHYLTKFKVTDGKISHVFEKIIILSGETIWLYYEMTKNGIGNWKIMMRIPAKDSKGEKSTVDENALNIFLRLFKSNFEEEAKIASAEADVKHKGNALLIEMADTSPELKKGILELHLEGRIYSHMEKWKAKVKAVPDPSKIENVQAISEERIRILSDQAIDRFKQACKKVGVDHVDKTRRIYAAFEKLYPLAPFRVDHKDRLNLSKLTPTADDFTHFDQAMGLYFVRVESRLGDWIGKVKALAKKAQLDDAAVTKNLDDTKRRIEDSFKNLIHGLEELKITGDVIFTEIIKLFLIIFPDPKDPMTMASLEPDLKEFNHQIDQVLKRKRAEIESRKSVITLEAVAVVAREEISSKAAARIDRWIGKMRSLVKRAKLNEVAVNADIDSYGRKLKKRISDLIEELYSLNIQLLQIGAIITNILDDCLPKSRQAGFDIKKIPPDFVNIEVLITQFLDKKKKEAANTAAAAAAGKK